MKCTTDLTEWQRISYWPCPPQTGASLFRSGLWSKGKKPCYLVESVCKRRRCLQMHPPCHLSKTSSSRGLPITTRESPKLHLSNLSTSASTICSRKTSCKTSASKLPEILDLQPFSTSKKAAGNVETGSYSLEENEMVRQNANLTLRPAKSWLFF